MNISFWGVNHYLSHYRLTGLFDSSEICINVYSLIPVPELFFFLKFQLNIAIF